MGVAEEIIEKAKNKYPCEFYYTGTLSAVELDEIEKYCHIHCLSIFMNGTGTFGIRYLKEQENGR